MWLAQASEPSPTPTVYMYLDQVSSGGGGLPPWVTTIAPFVASILALVGVIWASIFSARAARRSEDKRSAAAIAAEDRRAGAAIEAENLRHEHQLAHDEASWRRATRADAYFRALDVASRLIHAHTQYLWFNRPKGDKRSYEAVNGDRANEFIAVWNEAATDSRKIQAAVRAIGNPEVADCLDSIAAHSNSFFRATQEATNAAMKDLKQWPGDEVVGREHADSADRVLERMTALIRAELGAEPVTAPSADEAAPSASEQLSPESSPE